ncbi:unnamed protein product [Aspergillus oryzae]|nr:unnamed protein product [Aspergillus oryzae]GMF96072.1 unnamed protein product [Aspergillus oryzae]GMG11870.1 unnamed protein product [Aspergillus oryzae]
MSSIPPDPKTPAEWLKYVHSEVITFIPSKQEQKIIQVHESKIINPPSQLWYAYTDIFAFTKPEITISPEAYASMQIITRVLTADTPINLKIVPDTICWIYIYASILDQRISVSVDGQEPLLLELGPGTGNVGVKLIVFPDKIDLEYLECYMRAVDEELHASLNTQLCIARALQWNDTAIASSLCSYVVSVTTDIELSFYSQINAQAVALGQQLAAKR